MFFLSPNVTHFLNPLDDKDLAVFKKGINDIIAQNRGLIALKRGGLQEELLRAALQARKRLTPKAILASFANVGIVPWKRDIIVERAKLNLGILHSESQETMTSYDRVVRAMVKQVRQVRGEEVDGVIKGVVPDVENSALFSAPRALYGPAGERGQEESGPRSEEEGQRRA